MRDGWRLPVSGQAGVKDTLSEISTVAKEILTKLPDLSHRTCRARRVKLLCAVPRRASSAGANPARQLSFQPVAVGAAMEATKSSKPSTQRVASGDSASRQAAALWITTPLFPPVLEPSGRGRVAAIPQVGGLHHRYTAWRRQARGAWQSLASCRGTGSVCARARKTPPIPPLYHPLWKAISDPASAGESSPPRRTLLPPIPTGRRRFQYAMANRFRLYSAEKLVRKSSNSFCC